MRFQESAISSRRVEGKYRKQIIDALMVRHSRVAKGLSDAASVGRSFHWSFLKAMKSMCTDLDQLFFRQAAVGRFSACNDRAQTSKKANLTATILSGS
ncbi:MULTISPECIES: hypothetical protein [Sphingobium]|uniref:hypothetical protein n=1 Tax=Sphingobium sp. MI1205 TaxID=407020 RepID=UPI0013966871|nr:hypothetical protein [Sphingobium sp. MI1205]